MTRFNLSQPPSRLVAIILGITAMGIWATSFVLVKTGLAYTGPFTLAGLRYFLAFLLLLPWLAHGRPIRVWPATVWWRLFLNRRDRLHHWQWRPLLGPDVYTSHHCLIFAESSPSSYIIHGNFLAARNTHLATSWRCCDKSSWWLLILLPRSRW